MIENFILNCVSQHDSTHPQRTCQGWMYFCMIIYVVTLSRFQVRVSVGHWNKKRHWNPKKKKKNGIAEIWKFAGIWKILQKFAFFFFARFGQFLYCSDRVQVAQVLEMQTHQCRVLRTETYRQPTGPLVQVGIGLTSGGLAGLSGSSQV